MEGSTVITNETLKTIKKRRSIRGFKPEQIKDEELQAILEAGAYAPSARNQQAWHFTVVQNAELLASLSYEAKEVAKLSDNEYMRQLANNEQLNIFYGAPTVVIVSGNQAATLIEADCAAANQNMLLAAESLGLGSCWNNFSIYVFNGSKGAQFIKQLGIPEGFRPYYSVALGYKKIEAANAPERKPGLVNYVK
jgi:nitroreductase